MQNIRRPAHFLGKFDLFTILIRISVGIHPKQRSGRRHQRPRHLIFRTKEGAHIEVANRRHPIVRNVTAVTSVGRGLRLFIRQPFRRHTFQMPEQIRAVFRQEQILGIVQRVHGAVDGLAVGCIGFFQGLTHRLIIYLIARAAERRRQPRGIRCIRHPIADFLQVKDPE